MKRQLNDNDKEKGDDKRVEGAKKTGTEYWVALDTELEEAHLTVRRSRFDILSIANDSQRVSMETIRKM